MDMDVDKFGEQQSDEELVALIHESRSEDEVQAAIGELARRDSPLRFETFRYVLDDPKQGLTAKRTAVVSLGSGAPDEVRDLLLRHLTTNDPALFSRIADTLGKIGDSAALDGLESAKAPNDSAAMRSLQFAMSLISYRLHLEKHQIPAPSEAELVRVADGAAFGVERVDRATLQKMLSPSARQLPTIPLASGTALKITCRSIELLVLLNAEMEEPGAFELLLRRPALPALMLKKAQALDRYFLDGYFFTQPSGNEKGLDLLGTRPNGELTFAGNAYPSAKGYHFTLRSVNTRHAPAIDVAGEYAARVRAFEFTRTISSTRIAAESRKPAVPRRAHGLS